jgi:protein ImuB
MVRSLWVEPLISTSGIETAVAALADELAGVLAAATAGARRVRLLLYRVDGTVAVITVGTSRPCHDGAHIAGLLGEKLAGIDAGFGVDVVTLEAVRFETLSPSQQVFGRHLAGHDRQAFDLLLDRMTNRLGADRVRRLVTGASHLPEAAGVAIPVVADGHGEREPGKAVAIAAGRLGTGVARPLLLLTTPEPIEVMAAVPDGPPIRFTWRRLPHRIARAEGPERIAPEWWRWIGQPAAETTDLAAATPPPPRSRPRDY